MNASSRLVISDPITLSLFSATSLMRNLMRSALEAEDPDAPVVRSGAVVDDSWSSH